MAADCAAWVRIQNPIECMTPPPLHRETCSTLRTIGGPCWEHMLQQGPMALLGDDVHQGLC